jgi:hypothetical protein
MLLPDDAALRAPAPHNPGVFAGLWALGIRSADPGDECRARKSRAHSQVSPTCEGRGLFLLKV